MKFCRQSARFKTGFLQQARLAFLAGCCAVCAPWACAEPPPVPEAAWRVVITGSLQPQDMQSEPIPGARDTQFAAARAGAAGEGLGWPVIFLSRGEFAALGVDWAAFRAKSSAAASAELARLEPELIRDRNAVIECAIFHSQRRDITVAVLAPDFLKRFTPLFGRKMLVAIPDRHTVFLFPQLASRYEEYAGRVLAVYQKSDCPVSREVLEWSAEGVRAIGAFAGE